MPRRSCIRPALWHCPASTRRSTIQQSQSKLGLTSEGSGLTDRTKLSWMCASHRSVHRASLCVCYIACGSAAASRVDQTGSSRSQPTAWSTSSRNRNKEKGKGRGKGHNDQCQSAHTPGAETTEVATPGCNTSNTRVQHQQHQQHQQNQGVCYLHKRLAAFLPDWHAGGGDAGLSEGGRRGGKGRGRGVACGEARRPIPRAPARSTASPTPSRVHLHTAPRVAKRTRLALPMPRALCRRRAPKSRSSLNTAVCIDRLSRHWVSRLDPLAAHDVAGVDTTAPNRFPSRLSIARRNIGSGANLTALAPGHPSVGPRRAQPLRPLLFSRRVGVADRGGATSRKWRNVGCRGRPRGAAL
eukprot:365880-Chlamydomonas_euryale.AAC.3